VIMPRKKSTAPKAPKAAEPIAGEPPKDPNPLDGASWEILSNRARMREMDPITGELPLKSGLALCGSIAFTDAETSRAVVVRAQDVVQLEQVRSGQVRVHVPGAPGGVAAASMEALCEALDWPAPVALPEPTEPVRPPIAYQPGLYVCKNPTCGFVTKVAGGNRAMAHCPKCRAEMEAVPNPDA